jgi:hypothetical protein
MMSFELENVGGETPSANSSGAHVINCWDYWRRTLEFATNSMVMQ